MSISCLNKAIQVKGLKPTEKLILIILANYADEKGSCYPSHQHIADIAGLKDLKHIRSIIAKFKKLGHLKVEHRFRPDGGNISNRYHLSITLDEAVEQTIRGEGVQTGAGGDRATPPPILKKRNKRKIQIMSLSHFGNSIQERWASIKLG